VGYYLSQFLGQILVVVGTIGGGLYLLNKVFLYLTERTREQGEEVLSRKWRIAAWWAYIIGLPFIVALLAYKRDYIAAWIELGGAPAMIIGLVLAYREKSEKLPQWLNVLAIASIVVGCVWSFYELGVMQKFSQWLEIGLVMGFLVGTYDLARHKASGYLWFLLMHTSCGILMAVQEVWIMVLQQAVSLYFVREAYRSQIRKEKQDAILA